jgi:hypothetical protein
LSVGKSDDKNKEKPDKCLQTLPTWLYRGICKECVGRYMSVSEGIEDELEPKFKSGKSWVHVIQTELIYPTELVFCYGSLTNGQVTGNV